MDQPKNYEFPYSVEPPIHISWGIIGAVTAIAFGISGLTNKRALQVEGLMLTPDAATVFYWVMCVPLSGLFVLTVHLTIQSRMNPRRISLTNDSLSIPKSRWSSQLTIIPYATITNIAEIKVRGAPVFYLTHANGRIIVNPGDFKTAADYGPFCQLLIDYMRAARGAS